MADPFQPKFVDLVRNYSTTVGTGNFVLGPAVNGHSGFAAALQPGDTFYYSAIGVDKPAEREVGRGTLNGDGTVSRTPVSGAKTNFTTGTKTIALIAAAEWFTSVQAAAAAASSAAASIAPCATRAALAALGSSARMLPAMLSESGREGHFTFDSANLSAQVTADPAQGVYVPPASDASGASGAWVRRYSGPLSVRWFGAIGDSSTDDRAAIQAAIDFLGQSGGEILVPRGTYRCSARLVTSAPIHLFGEIVGQDSRASGFPAAWLGSTLYFDAGVGGIFGRFITSNDLSGTADVPGSGGSVIERLRLCSAGAGAASPGKYGIEWRARVTIRDVEVRGFGDHGVHIRASLSGGDGVVYGNANGSRLSNVRSIVNAGDGFRLSGNDANCIKVENCLGQLNTGWSFTDDGLIDNSYDTCIHEGSVAGGYRTLRSVAAHVFIGCETEGGTNSIGTSSVVIGGNLASSNGVPRWQNYTGITLRNGNTVQLNAAGDASSTTLAFDGSKLVCAAGGSFAGALSGASASFGGALTSSGNLSAGTDGSNIHSFLGAANFYNSIKVRNGTGLVVLNAGESNFATINHDGAKLTADAGMTFAGALAASNLSGTNSGDETSSSVTAKLSAFTGDVTKASGGTATTIAAGAVSYAKMQNVAASRIVGNPTGSASAPSEISLAGGLSFSGTTLTAAGALTPTSVASTGAITSSGGAVGYSTGAGGTVTQATSKSTGVTLNKLCGQVTMNAAALAAGAIVEFTVSNTQVAAADTINVNLASGAATSSAYRYWISAVAAGSFKVAVENRSAGALGEALVLSFALLKAVNA